MDVIFLRQIPGDPEPDEVYENKVSSFEVNEPAKQVAEPEPEQILMEPVRNEAPAEVAVNAIPGETMQAEVQQEATVEEELLSITPKLTEAELSDQRFEFHTQIRQQVIEEEVGAPMDDPESYAESEGTAMLRSQIAEKNESEAMLRAQVEELAARLNDQIFEQQQNDQQREDQINQLNLQWTQKAENLRTQALQEAEDRHRSEREQSQQLIQQMQERLGSLESTISREQQERMQIEQILQDRQKETQSLQQQMQDLENEKRRIEAEKANMREQLEKQNLEIEQLREELSRSRANTPQREFPTAQPNRQSSGFSLMGSRPLRGSQPVLTHTGPVRSGGFGSSFGSRPQVSRPAPVQPQLQQPRIQVSSGISKSEERHEQRQGGGFGGSLGVSRPAYGISKSSEPAPARENYRTPAASYNTPQSVNPRLTQPKPVMRSSRTPETTRQPGGVAKSPMDDREAFIRNMALNIKRKRSNPRVVE